MSSELVRVDELCVRLAGREIIKEVSFSLAAGEQVAVIGPNGAGKSTLVRCIDGLLPAVGGRVLVAGRDVAQMSRREIARELAYVPQADDRLADFKVQAFVEMGRYPHLRGWSSLGGEDVRAVRDALELTETFHLRDRHLATLSGGERQRVHIAAALAQGGRVMLLDEPTSFLDYRHQVQLRELLERLRRERELGIIAVTHDLNSAVAASQQVVALKEGRVMFRGHPSALLDGRMLTAIFDTGFDLVAVPGRELPVAVATESSR